MNCKNCDHHIELWVGGSQPVLHGGKQFVCKVRDKNFARCGCSNPEMLSGSYEVSKVF